MVFVVRSKLPMGWNEEMSGPLVGVDMGYDDEMLREVGRNLSRQYMGREVLEVSGEVETDIPTPSAEDLGDINEL